MRMLVSVRSVDEALIAARGGADFIDLKEPRGGALGGLPVAAIRTILAALRKSGSRLAVSATIGDLSMSDATGIMAQVEAVGACGVDYVKVGIEREPAALSVLEELAACDRSVVPVFIADRGLDLPTVVRAAALGFPGLMVDTADKRAGSLFDVLTNDELRRFVALVRTSGAMVGLAGALRLAHVPALHALSPDFAGFRSAVCVADRGSALDADRLHALSALMKVEPALSAN